MAKVVRLIALLAVVASVPSCGFSSSKLTFLNGTDSQIVGLTVSDGRKTWKLRDLESGEQVNFRGHLAGEGGATVAWTWHGQRFKGEGCYYTGGSPAHGTVKIVGAKLDYRCD